MKDPIQSRESRTPMARRTGWTLLLAALSFGWPASAQAQDETPSVAPSLEPVGQLGATEPILLEAFDQAPPWLEVEKVKEGETKVVDGTVFMSIDGSAVHYQDWYELETSAPVLRAEVSVDLDRRDGTAAGVSCGSALGLPRWFVAGVNNGDTWFLARIIDGRLQVVDRGSLDPQSSASGGTVRIGIECAVAPEEGGDYVAVSVDGDPVSIETGLGRLDIPVGPYDKAGLFVGTDSGTGSAVYDDLAVWVGDAYLRSSADRDPDATSQ
jgi:hypothetical protein